jgi:hypothetical protein
VTDSPRERISPLDRFAVRLHPQVRERDDGTFEGSYPGMDWTVTGGTAEEVMDQLQAEDLRHNDLDPYARIEKIESVIVRHLENPVDGVQLLDRAEYDRLSKGPNAEAELDLAFAQGLDC